MARYLTAAELDDSVLHCRYIRMRDGALRFGPTEGSFSDMMDEGERRQAVSAGVLMLGTVVRVEVRGSRELNLGWNPADASYLEAELGVPVV